MPSLPGFINRVKNTAANKACFSQQCQSGDLASRHVAWQTRYSPGRCAGGSPRRSDELPRKSDQKAPSPLPKTAQRLVDAARKVVLARGYAGLTLDAVEAEAGLNKSLVRYYFGDKAGLVAALVDSLFPRQADLAEETARAGAGGDQLRALLHLQRGVATDDDVNRLFWELLPHVLRDRELLRRFAAAYRESRLMDGSCVQAAGPDIDGAQAERLAALTVAVLEGLSIQRVIDPGGLDFEGAYADWESMLLAFLASGRE
jgi:AcrR family transcriptional regulator